tara:strand:- start:371 stop:1123 length:753 start_codon:yes stop_codon:yes gene_type:complete
MASKIKVDQIEGSTGSSITIPSGQTLTVTDGIASTSLTGTINDARLPTVPVSKGGTGVTSLGTANQVLAVNSGANALEFQNASSGGVKQMKVTTKTTSFTTSSGFNSYVDVTGLSVSITPSSTSSRILVLCNANIASENLSGGLIFLKFVRNIGGGSFANINESTDSGSYHHSHAEIEANTSYGYVGHTPLGLKFFDHPNTTSAVIYKAQMCTNGSNTAVLGRSGRADANVQDIKNATQLMAIEIDGGIL